jgi:hypothetical protein
MATKLVYMPGEDFVDMILMGERDFSRMRIRRGF